MTRKMIVKQSWLLIVAVTDITNDNESLSTPLTCGSTQSKTPIHNGLISQPVK